MIQGTMHFQNSSELSNIGLVAFNVIVILHDLNGYSTDGENLWTVWERWLNLSRDIGRESSLGQGEKD